MRPSASAARIPISLKGYSGNAAGCAPRFARTTVWPEWKKQVIGRARAGTGLLQPLPPCLCSSPSPLLSLAHGGYWVESEKPKMKTYWERSGLVKPKLVKES